MPTGYTGQLTDESTLKDFATICTGAFIRDFPNLVMDNYTELKQRLDRIKSEYESFQTLSNEELERQFHEWKSQKIEWYTNYLAKQQREQSRYKSMLERVKQWNPSSELIELKNFMISQLEVSFIDVSYWQRKLDEFHSELTFDDWYESTLAEKQSDIEYCEKELQRTEKYEATVKRWSVELDKITN